MQAGSTLPAESQETPVVAPFPPQTEFILEAEIIKALEVDQTAPLVESTLPAQSPVAPEAVPTGMQSGSALRSESQDAPEIISTPPPPVESELRAESPIAPEVVSTPTSTQSPTHGLDLAPVQVNTATTQEQAYLTQAPGPATTQPPPRPSAATAIGAPVTLEAVSTPMPSDKVIPEVEPHDATELVSSPQPAEVTFQIESTESPPVSSSPAAAATPTLSQPERAATPPEPAPDLSEDELIWYPTAEEIVLGEGAYEVALIDEALEALEETQEPSDLGTAPIPDEAPTPQTGAAFSSHVDSASPTPVEELIQSRPPESRPEQMPDFPVESLAVEPQAPLPPTPPPPESVPEHIPVFLVETPAVEPQVPLAPPPLHEEDLLDNQSAAPPSQVLIDRLPGPRMIVGDLAKPGIIITIRDAVGHAVVLVSGTAPHHGPGGFEAPLTSDGTYDVTFDHHALQVHITDETIFLQLSS